MRRLAPVLALCLFSALPLFAQNTDIESLSGLQFNFGNPGARSLGMGGAFLGLADDASAAEANPAGLTILRKREFSIEARNWLEDQILSTSGTYPAIDRTAFGHYSDRVEISFASFVYPVKNFTLGVYYHAPLKNSGSGQVIPQRNDFTGQIEKEVPNFYLPKGGGQGPVTQQQCEALRRAANDPFACLEYTINPFLTALDVEEKTWGFAAAYKVGQFSFGATARYQTFRASSFTFRLTPTYDFQSISVQATAKSGGTAVDVESKKDLTFAVGTKWEPKDWLSVGAVYKKGGSFDSPTFIANANTDFEFVKLADTVFHIPDVMGAGRLGAAASRAHDQRRRRLHQVLEPRRRLRFDDHRRAGPRQSVQDGQRDGDPRRRRVLLHEQDSVRDPGRLLARPRARHVLERAADHARRRRCSGPVSEG